MIAGNNGITLDFPVWAFYKDDMERDGLVRYTEEQLAPRMQVLIERLVPIFKVLRLSETSFPPRKVDLRHIGEGGILCYCWQHQNATVASDAASHQ